MGEHEEDREGQSVPLTRANPRDGLIDFTRYSLAQLEELQYGIDPDSSPRDYANLLAELERRRQPTQHPQTSERWIVGRFTARDELLGWLQAKLRRAPVYGAGSMAVRSHDVG
jgi:hypothetical protein